MSLSVFCCGDVVNFSGKKDFICSEIKNVITDSDFSICNFEAPVQSYGMNKINKAGPCLYQAKSSVSYIAQAGFNLVSLANNHIFDYGDKALKSTLLALSECGVDYVGAGIDFESAYREKIIKKDGIIIGVLAACENEFGCLDERKNRGGYAWLFHPLLEDKIRSLKKKTTAIVLIAHAGVENIDFPIKEWRERYKRLCDIGVDVVIGHHPHVPQGYESYADSVIFYSLGNFYFDTAGFENKADESFSVKLLFGMQGLTGYEFYYHKKIAGKTCLMNKNDMSFSLEKLNALLSEEYGFRNDFICIELYEKYYSDYYRISQNRLPDRFSVVYLIKFLVKNIFFRSKYAQRKNLLLLHNIRIESHRFVVQRALSLLNEK